MLTSRDRVTSSSSFVLILLKYFFLMSSHCSIIKKATRNGWRNSDHFFSRARIGPFLTIPLSALLPYLFSFKLRFSFFDKSTGALFKIPCQTDNFLCRFFSFFQVGCQIMIIHREIANTSFFSKTVFILPLLMPFLPFFSNYVGPSIFPACRCIL